MSRANRLRREQSRLRVAGDIGDPSRYLIANRPPSHETRPSLLLAETVPPAVMRQALLSEINDHLRTYQFGECSVMVTREYRRWHLSIAHPTRLPTWNEVAAARYRLLPDEIRAAMMLPPKAEYINMHQFCLHVYEIRGDESKGLEE